MQGTSIGYTAIPTDVIWECATGATYWDDLYVDDINTYTVFPGDIRIAAIPASALNTNNFDTGIGSGANRYDRVAEVPLSVTNGWQHAANSDVQENYGIASQEAAGLAGATILGYTGWVYGKRGDIATVLVREIGNVQSKT
jgi:hypothetical protein